MGGVAGAILGGGSGGGAVAAPPPVSVPAPIPQTQNPQGLQASTDAASRAKAAGGAASTVLTGSAGLQAQASTSQKSLLGQ